MENWKLECKDLINSAFKTVWGFYPWDITPPTMQHITSWITETIEVYDSLWSSISSGHKLCQAAKHVEGRPFLETFQGYRFAIIDLGLSIPNIHLGNQFSFHDISVTTLRNNIWGWDHFGELLLSKEKTSILWVQSMSKPILEWAS